MFLRWSDIFVFRFDKIWHTTDRSSPQTFSVTAVVVAPAVYKYSQHEGKWRELQVTQLNGEIY